MNPTHVVLVLSDLHSFLSHCFSYHKTMPGEKRRLISSEIKQLILEKSKNGEDYNEIATSLNLNYRAVQSIVKRSKDDRPFRRRGRATKLDANAKAMIRNIIDDDCTVTIDFIKQKLSDSGYNVSRWTIGRAIKGFNYSLKRTSFIPERRNTPSTILERKSYSEAFLSFDINKVYFLDEAGFQYSMRRSKGRSAKGTKAAKVVPVIRSKNISLCACISNTSVFFSRLWTAHITQIISTSLSTSFSISLQDWTSMSAFW